MTLTRAQQAAQRAVQEGRLSSVSDDQNSCFTKRQATPSKAITGRQPQRIGQQRDHKTQLREPQSRRCTTRKHLPPPTVKDCITPNKRGTKRRLDAPDNEPADILKRPRQASPVKEPSIKFLNNIGGNCESNPINFWVREGKWPQEYLKPDMEHLLARKKSLSSLGRKRSNSATSITPSDQRPREEKSAAYRDPRYQTLLETKASFMSKSSLGITAASKSLCTALLDRQQSVPEISLFGDSFFESTCSKINNKNEARIIQDISRLIVPSGESLATLGASHLDILAESVNEGWNNSIPLVGSRPQPDYSIGFKREAFNDEQLAKLSPFIGDFLFGDQSLFMATYFMYFPFLTCEVKCGAGALDVADRQNAHSMTLAVRAVAELFRAVKRANEVHRQVLAFSMSHDHESVRIYGHYPEINGKDIKYYRHTIRKFNFTELDGREKWTAYRFTKNVYDSWMPSHFKMICSAIDQLPADLDFDNPSLVCTGLSQGLESHHLSQSDVSFAAEQESHHLSQSDVSFAAEQESQSDQVKQGRRTPDTSLTGPGTTKKRRGKK